MSQIYRIRFIARLVVGFEPLRGSYWTSTNTKRQRMSTFDSLYGKFRFHTPYAPTSALQRVFPLSYPISPHQSPFDGAQNLGHRDFLRTETKGAFTHSRIPSPQTSDDVAYLYAFYSRGLIFDQISHLRSSRKSQGWSWFATLRAPLAPHLPPAQPTTPSTTSPRYRRRHQQNEGLIRD